MGYCELAYELGKALLEADTIIERINDLDFYPNIETYALLPIIIFILKEYRNKIIINVDKKLIIAH